ncbi:MAG: UvrD-helicase domain-containing protein [Bacteroidetes bacterium]|nr:UvrD-helicase domain-containing protein [Bacteroidota bacterium]
MATNELVIYRSSAGSGKTYTLVLEYLKLVLEKPGSYRAILAITFTNKATEEMKNRIIGALVAIAGNNQKELQEEVALQTGIPIQQLPSRAAKVLDHILHDYSGFAVSTIDSFFSKMVRSLARELHLPLRFDIELDIDAVIRDITNLVFADIATDDALRKWLQNFVFDKLDNEKGWRIEQDLHKIAKQLFSEKYRRIFYEENTIPEIQLIIELKKIKSTFEKQMALFSDEFVKIISENEFTVEDFNQGKKGVAGYLIKIKNPVKDEGYIPGKRFYAALEEANGWTTKTSKNKEVIQHLATSQLMPLANKVAALLDKEFARYIGATVVLSTAYVAGVIGILDEKLKIFRVENELVLLSDTNMILNKAISGQDAPFIYEKNGNKFNHFMLDEFQDTSDFQWQNLLPLIQNSLGSGNYTLIVGDAKQSIYRWRGGNMQLLLKGIGENLHGFNEITRNLKLEANYRSREVIVNFNNAFFSRAPEMIGVSVESGDAGNAYASEGLTQQWKKGKAGDGYVKIKFFETIDEIIEEEDEDEDANGKWAEQSCLESLKTLHQLFQNGYEPGDVAILTRTNKDAKEITAFLLKNGISKIISPESMQLYHSPKISFLINLLTFLINYDDDLALAYVTYYWRTRNHTAVDLNEVFAESKKNKLNYLPESFRKRQKEFRKIPLYEVVEELAILFELNKQPEAFMQRFLDVVLEYSDKNPANIHDFLIWWEEHKEKDNCSVIVPSGENAIRVMSIHKSKGLQFPVVIIPFADWKLGPRHDELLWVKSDETPFNGVQAHPVYATKKLANSIFKNDFEHEVLLNNIDNLNMLYVACTRAEEQLYVFTQKPKETKEITINSAGKLIYYTLKKAPEWNALLQEDPVICFELGSFTTPFRKKDHSGRTGKDLLQWISVPWKDRLKMLISKKKISVYDPEPPETTYGTLFHAIAAEINSSKVIQDVLQKHIHESNVEEPIKIRLLKEISYFVSVAETHGWLDDNAETLNETDLLLEDGSVLRPDRLILKQNEAIIIDYKTGAEEKFHPKQVQQYAGVLKRMGYSKVKMILVYLSLEKIVEVAA